MRSRNTPSSRCAGGSRDSPTMSCARSSSTSPFPRRSFSASSFRTRSCVGMRAASTTASVPSIGTSFRPCSRVTVRAIESGWRRGATPMIRARGFARQRRHTPISDASWRHDEHPALGRLDSVRGFHPLALGSGAQARWQCSRRRPAHGRRARTRRLHTPAGGREHLGGALERHRSLRSCRGGRPVRTGSGQGVPTSDLLLDSRGGEEPLSAQSDLFSYLLRLGDTSLILGQRLGEWVGHAPALEEDLGLGNLALDLIGQARLLLTYAGETEGRGRDEDALAFLRDAPEFANLALAEQPNGDFGQTIVRQWLIDARQIKIYEGLGASSDTRLAAIAAKALRETRYHYRFSSGWLVRLGDGTPESHERVQGSLEELWRFTAELFAPDEVDLRMHAAAIAPALPELAQRWSARIDEDLRAA